MKLSLLKIWSLVLKIWDWINGNKVLIGLVLNLINTKFIDPGTTLYDIMDIIVYAFIGVGGTHKIVKMRKDYVNGKHNEEIDLP